ncbi:leucine zipper domain-containing protein, partial [Streptomyces sp. NPDC051132]|uniref:leucine zipper domain-containing protein n=1 Tax=Streptomyces sp. NPDC051132 TaxID=3155667 RepID=UPI003442289B
RNARLTVHGRRLLVERVSGGRPVAHVARVRGGSSYTATTGLTTARSSPRPRG